MFGGFGICNPSIDFYYHILNLADKYDEEHYNLYVKPVGNRFYKKQRDYKKQQAFKKLFFGRIDRVHFLEQNYIKSTRIESVSSLVSIEIAWILQKLLFCLPLRSIFERRGSKNICWKIIRSFSC